MNTIDYYLNLPYEIVVKKVPREDGGGYFAYFKDFTGVMGDGETDKEAIEDAWSAFKCYLEVAIDNGEEILEPSHLTKSKRVNITVPASTLEKIDVYAKNSGMNRSTFLVECALKQINSDEKSIAK